MVGPRVTAVAIAAILLLSACTLGAPQQGKSRSGAPSSPKAVTPGSVQWTDCGSGFQCASVTVPLDYAHPDAGTIDIAINRKPATDQANRIGSLLINPGGPGASGVDWVHDGAFALPDLNRRFDLVGFDPRGVSRSAPIRCLDGPQWDAFNALDGVLDDPQEKQAAIQADQAFAAACAQRNSRVLPFVDTMSAAKDMDLIRAALGDSKLTYMGFSYGTYLGQMYAHLYPTHVRALVLDGVLDPSVSLNDQLVPQLTGFEQNLHAFLNNCSARKCEYARSGDPYTKLTALMQRVDVNPIPVGSRMLTRGLAMTGVLWRVYYQDTWPLLEQALAAIDRGDASVLLAAADDYYSRSSDGTYANEADANSAINCLDHPVPSDIATYDQLGPALVKISPFFGAWFQYSDLNCAYWSVKPTGKDGPLTADGAAPILVVGGTGDPVTPYAWAQSVNRQLAGSVLLTRKGNGHTSYFASTCIQQAEDAYLLSLTLPPDGTVCT
jgi:pimeloyl-ACP methyl ester carboxylesterase